MRPLLRIATLSLLACVVAGCGDDDGGADLPDAPPRIDAPVLPDTCDLVAQDCPDGYKCTFVAPQGILERGCELVTGARAEGEPCTGGPGRGDDCARGLMCGEETQVCRRFCDGNDTCAADQACTYFRAGGGVCREHCEPFDAEGCPGGQTCTFLVGYDATAHQATACWPVGDATVGEPCDWFTWCAADHVCGDAGCLPLCDDAHPCDAGTCDQPTAYPWPNPASAGACL